MHFIPLIFLFVGCLGKHRTLKIDILKVEILKIEFLKIENLNIEILEIEILKIEFLENFGYVMKGSLSSLV